VLFYISRVLALVARGERLGLLDTATVHHCQAKLEKARGNAGTLMDMINDPIPLVYRFAATIATQWLVFNGVILSAIMSARFAVQFVDQPVVI
jgi:hypothetical protein